MGMEKITQKLYDRDELDKARTAMPDTKESFEAGKLNDPYQPNIWPPEGVIPGFQGFMESFFVHCTALIHNVLRCMAVALDMPDPEALSNTHSEDLFQLRLLHYPSVARKALEARERTRIGAHSDFGTITLLFQDKVGGLEVEDPYRPGQFTPATPVDGACLVNVGDLIERWTNGRWRSTVHRVGAPPTLKEMGMEGEGDAEGNEGEMCAPRYSIPFFSITNFDEKIDALPGCWDENNPKKYKPVTTREYFSMRMAALY